MMQSSCGSFTCQLNQGLRRSILHCTVPLSPAKRTHCRPSRRQHRVAHIPCQQGTKQPEGREAPGQAAAMSVTVASPYFLIAAIILFSLVAYDVRGPGLRLLPQYVDGPAHAWVRDHLPSPVRALVAEKLVSDFFISLGIIGWVMSLSASIVRDPVPALKRGALCSSIYFLGGGSIKGQDPFLVDQLKAFFHRMRPTELNHTYAFPSGHTTAATFIVGTLVVVLLPALTAPPGPEATGFPDSKGARRSLARGLQSAAIPLWALAVITTATGRVLGDVHWCSDTMAGACLGAALVSTTAMVTNALNAKDEFR